MGLGEKIRKLRIAAKLTQMEFAEMCGVTTQAIQKWENGSYSPSLEKLVLLSKHFHVSLPAPCSPSIRPRQSRAWSSRRPHPGTPAKGS